MITLDDVEVVVAATGEDGKPYFVEVEQPTRSQGREDGPTNVGVWRSPEVPKLPYEIGATPAFPDRQGWPTPGGTRVMVISFPPRSAGKDRVAATVSGDPHFHVGENDDPGMHRTDSVDYEIVVSGKIDIELPGGQVRTLRPGSCVVMGGVTHSWQNRYDEPCVFMAVIVGARTD